MRKLTVRQTAVLAAIERRPLSNLLDLWEDFPDLAPSTVERVIRSLEARGLVARIGDPEQLFVGGVLFVPVAQDEMHRWLEQLMS